MRAVFFHTTRKTTLLDYFPFLLLSLWRAAHPRLTRGVLLDDTFGILNPFFLTLSSDCLLFIWSFEIRSRHIPCIIHAFFDPDYTQCARGWRAGCDGRRHDLEPKENPRKPSCKLELHLTHPTTCLLLSRSSRIHYVS